MRTAVVRGSRGLSVGNVRDVAAQMPLAKTSVQKGRTIEDIAANPIYLDVSLQANAEFVYAVPPGHTTLAYVFEGAGCFGAEAEPVEAVRLIVFDEGDQIAARSDRGVRFMLMAGALGIPFIPTRSFLGTDYLRTDYTRHPGGFRGKDKWALMESPFDGQRVVLLPALRPEVALIHAHRADEEGNVQMWGHLGDARWACWAARKVIVSVEEIVPSEVIRSDPSRTIVPGFRVSAVVHMPFGAHPSGITGYYDFDYAFQGHMAPALRDQANFEKFAEEWIHAVQDHRGYIEHYKSVFGAEALESLSVRAGGTPKDGVRYTYAPQMRF